MITWMASIHQHPPARRSALGRLALASHPGISRTRGPGAARRKHRSRFCQFIRRDDRDGQRPLVRREQAAALSGPQRPEGLRLEHATRTYVTDAGIVPALRDASAHFAPGLLHVLCGDSGSGKSTLLRILGGLEAPDSLGGLWCAGRAIHRADAATRRWYCRDVVSLLPQNPPMPGDHLSALDAAAYPLRLLGHSRRAGRNRAAQMLQALGLSPRDMARPCSRLSGGQRQRVGLARAMVHPSAQVLLLDEPTNHLDADNVDQVIRLLQDTARERGCTVLVASHDERMAKAADVLWRVDHGVLSDPAARRTAGRTDRAGRLPLAPACGVRRSLPWWFVVADALRSMVCRSHLPGTLRDLFLATVVTLSAIVAPYFALNVYDQQSSILRRAMPDRVTVCATGQTGRMTPDQIRRMAGLPGVTRVFPAIELLGKNNALAGRDPYLHIIGSPHDDPAAAADRLVWGQPFHANAENEAIVPEDVYYRLGGRLGPGPTVDRLRLAFTRSVGGIEEPLELEFRVVALREPWENGSVLIPWKVACALDRWLDTPNRNWDELLRGPVASDRGHFRAHLDADGESKQPGLVRALQQEGFEVRHQLDRTAALRRLGHMLLLLAIVIVGYTTLTSSAAVTSAAWAAQDLRKREITIFRLHATPLPLILAHSLVRPLVVGVAGYLAGVLLVPLARSVVASALEAAVGSRLGNFLTVDLFSPSLAWVYAAAAIPVALGLLGSTFPALAAMRRSPAQLLADD